MDVFDLLKEVVKGIVRAISAHLFRKTFLNKAKTTRRRRKQGGSQKVNFMTTTACTAEAAGKRMTVLPLSYLYPSKRKYMQRSMDFALLTLSLFSKFIIKNYP